MFRMVNTSAMTALTTSTEGITSCSAKDLEYNVNFLCGHSRLYVSHACARGMITSW